MVGVFGVKVVGVLGVKPSTRSLSWYTLEANLLNYLYSPFADDNLRADSPLSHITNGYSQQTTLSPAPSPNHRTRSLPHKLQNSTDNPPVTLSPVPYRHRSPSPGTPNTLSPIPYRRNRSSSPIPSPILAAKNFFRLSGSHLKDTSSRGSPILGRRKQISKGLSREGSTDSEFLFSWMDSSGHEVDHWQQMLDAEGKWVYCWHALRPKLKPAYS